MRAAVPVLLALLVAGCAQPPRPGFGDVVRVCDGAGCRDQPKVSLAGPQELDRSTQRQQDPDAYRGEPVAALRSAAEGGDAGAAYRLGQAHEAGAGGLPRSTAQAARWYGAAAEAGMPFAAFRLARLVEQGAAPGGRARAVQLYAAAAGGGVAQAAHNLGVMALEGRGLPRDPAEAFRWFTQAAENGVPESQYNLALMYFRGEGTPRQPYEAIRWMRRAGENGVLPAQLALGRLTMTGLEEQGQDMQEAQSWLSMAAARGDAEAKRLLPGVTRAAQADRDAYQAWQRQYALQVAATRGYWAAMTYWSTLALPPVLFVRTW
ncbi:tetratricopeptide repeat protein [Roseicella aquatilis]|uniref:Sel1 repeat family protein n=1 Tax=Roseicella aquatilis TaxID=2527868 RepID=A0A4R4D9U8_9PROT|nr:tetratricopeptide repeat protein [Roseicella aquatilis]TCZ57173.1 sel1 repeat family protein [Roseicella aquatilis]